MGGLQSCDGTAVTATSCDCNCGLFAVAIMTYLNYEGHIAGLPAQLGPICTAAGAGPGPDVWFPLHPRCALRAAGLAPFRSLVNE